MSIEIIGHLKPVKGYPFLTAKEAFAVTGNTGNLAFYEAIRSHVPGCVDVSFEDRGNINSTGIIPCSNFIGAHAKNKFRARFCKSYEGNLVAVGLGAQGQFNEEAIDVGEGTGDFLDALTKKAINGPNISVRGGFTKKIIEKLGYGEFVEVLGCPSLFLNPNKKLGKLIERNSKGQLKKFAVCAGSPLGGDKYKNLESQFSQLVSKTHGSYIVQHPFNLVQLAMGEYQQMANNLVERYREVLTPDLNINQFKKWSKRHVHTFFNLDAWVGHLQSHDIMVGTRIHGCMFALQAGIPAVCIIHDSRTEELCKIMKIPYIFINDIDITNIDNIVREFVINYDWNEFDENRAALREKYIKFMRNNRVNINI